MMEDRFEGLALIWIEYENELVAMSGTQTPHQVTDDDGPE